MTHHRSAGAAAALTLALTFAIALPGGAAADGTRFELLWVGPATPRAAEPARSHTAPVLLNLPSGWRVGDAVAVVASEGLGAETSNRLRAVLIGEGAAVLEIDLHVAREPSPDGGAPAATLAPGDLLPDFLGALLALRRDVGAGLVVALGYGSSGQAALLAARDDLAATFLGQAGPRFAAAAALGPGPTAFAAGSTPPVAESWPTRAPLLCAALARAAVLSSAELERDCIAALVAPVMDQPAAAPPASAQRRHGY